MTDPSIPEPTDADVLRLIKINGLSAEPVHVPFRNLGYSPRYCHISTKHHALVNGGKRVHGWAVWRWAGPDEAPENTILFAEHHSVWQTPDGALVDMTPPTSGADKVLFIRDDSADIKTEGEVFLMRTDLTDEPSIRRVFQGNPTSFEFWPLSSENNQGAIAYAAAIGFDLARLATEPEVG